jgi:transcriptional regulator with XRE-family HTH domain
MPDTFLSDVTDWQQVIGTNVRLARQKAGLTQEQLALEAKIDLTYAGGIERGKRNPSVLVLARLADALGTTPADLLKPQF